MKSSRHGWHPLIRACPFPPPGYDFDRSTYVLEVSGQGREGRVRFSREFLDDVRDNKTPAGSRYSQELQAKLTDALREVIESNGLISFSEKAIKYKLLQFIYKESKEREHIEKYNTIGRDAPGDLERWLRITLTKDEKETLIWIWGDLLRLRLITPTGKDLVVPDNWSACRQRQRGHRGKIIRRIR